MREREREIEKERDRSWVGHGQRDRSSGGRLHAARSRQDDLSGAISQLDLDGSISRRDLVSASGVGAVVRWLVCSSSSLSLLAFFLSLSLGVCESGNHLKVKQKRK